jgi:hypothetical protein
MKKSLPLLALAALMFTGCIKSIIDGTKANTAGDFTLKLTRTDLAGQSTTQVNHVLNIPEAGELAAAVEPKLGGVHIRLGGQPLDGTTTVTLNIMASLEFSFTNQPQAIAGTYTFPQDAGKLMVRLGQRVGNDWAMRQPPLSGTVVVNYDAATQTWNGTLTNLVYAVQAGEPLKALSLSGKFSHLPLK